MNGGFLIWALILVIFIYVSTLARISNTSINSLGWRSRRLARMSLGCRSQAKIALRFRIMIAWNSLQIPYRTRQIRGHRLCYVLEGGRSGAISLRCSDLVDRRSTPGFVATTCSSTGRLVPQIILYSWLIPIPLRQVPWALSKSTGLTVTKHRRTSSDGMKRLCRNGAYYMPVSSSYLRMLYASLRMTWAAWRASYYTSSNSLSLDRPRSALT